MCLPPNHPSQKGLIDAATSTIGTSDRAYLDALAKAQELSTIRGLSAVFDEFQLDALVIPADSFNSEVATETKWWWPRIAMSTSLAASAGWPIVSLKFLCSP